MGDWFLDKFSKKTEWGKDNLLNKWCCDKWISPCKRMKLDPYHLPYAKVYSKWKRSLNVDNKTIKLWEENIGRVLHDIELDNSFLDMTVKLQEKIDKLNFIKIKNVLQRAPSNKWKDISNIDVRKSWC